MKKKKILLSLILVISMLMWICMGCITKPSTSDNDDKDPKTPGGSKKNITLSLWWWQGDMEQAWNEHLIADFETDNPGIKVELTILPWSEYWSKVQTATISNTLPDLMIMSVAYIDQYAKEGVVIDLTDYINRDLDRSEYYNFAMLTTRMNDGREYGMPWNVVGNCLFYNKDMFDDAGLAYPDATWTWDILRENAIKLTKADKSQYGLSMTVGGESSFDSILYSFGGAIVSDDLKTCLLDTQGSKDGIKFLRKMILEDQCMPPVTTDSSGINDFSSGLAAMAVDGCWSLETVATASDLNWDIAPLPAGPNGSKPRAWSDSICISKSCKNPDEAWKFIKYLVGENGQTHENLTSTRIPVYIPKSMSTDFLNSNTVSCNLQVLLDQLEIASPFVFRANWGEWVGVQANELFGIWTGNLTVDQGAANAAVAVQAILDEYNAK